MLKQPKGLIAAALANTGERFGFYTMMAILTLFLMSKFGIDGEQAGKIYSFFYTSIYILALVGGLIADRLRNYKGTIIAGILVMTVGYAALMVPSVTSKAVVIGALMVIAFGNGLFKGNLQALVGQLYDNEQYAKLRDTGFQIFYMFINIGAMFAPFAAVGVRNWWLRTQGFLYNSDLSALCHQYIGGTMSPEVAQGRFSELAAEVSIGGVPADMGVFAQSYLNAFNTGFHYAFGVAIVALVFSLVVFLANKKKLPDPKVAAASKATPSKAEIQQDAREIKQRLYALFAVFAIVIFFWFSFHQNGLTLTLFAQDYTRLEIFGMPITAEIFQSANPFCVVFLTPVIIAVFAWLRNRGKEPSTPMKIAIGMGIAAFAYVLMVFGSLGLPKLAEVQAQGGLSFAERVTPWLLVATYLILTIAELFISPLGLSFVSKVAPQKLQGLMQGCWLGATALGNGLLFIGPILYKRISISATWSIFVIVCAISMFAMLAMDKWLERVPFPTKSPQESCGGFFSPICADLFVIRADIVIFVTYTIESRHVLTHPLLSVRVVSFRGVCRPAARAGRGGARQFARGQHFEGVLQRGQSPPDHPRGTGDVRYALCARRRVRMDADAGHRVVPQTRPFLFQKRPHGNPRRSGACAGVLPPARQTGGAALFLLFRLGQPADYILYEAEPV